MINEFYNKLNNNLYISNYLYTKLKEQSPNSIPKDFDIEKYNNEILERDYIKYCDYFQNMYKGIDDTVILDKDQIKSILADEDYSLIIAGAGTGKTTTIAAKVKYLTEIKKVSPEKIVVISYTKKATLELYNRIVVDFGIPANVTTFHSLGLKYIRHIFNNRKCYVVDDYEKNKIFISFFKEILFKDKKKMKEIIELFPSVKINKFFAFSKYFKDNFEKYNTFEEFFENYKKDRISNTPDLKEKINGIIYRKLNSENITTLNQELVKSKGEAVIANFLYCNGIEYEYERVYSELLEENKTYKPDFTLDLNGEKVYIEYFGLSNYDDIPYSRYDKIKQKKLEYHKANNNKLIAIDYDPNETITSKLKRELLALGFTFKPKTYEEIYDNFLSNNEASQFYLFRDFLYEVIESIKISSKRTNYIKIAENYCLQFKSNEREELIKEFKFINEFYDYYQKALYDKTDYGFDYADMIYYANKYIDTLTHNENITFEYIIIDEYQDISEQRYTLTKKIADREHAKLIAVGDDWQSIYAFSGSKIEYVYNFQKYFEGAKILKFSKTYRNSQKLIDYSGEFIMKNETQIKKHLISDKQILKPIKFIEFNSFEEEDTLKKLILNIHQHFPSHNILILGRTNKIIDNLENDKELVQKLNSKITYIGYEDINIEAMTIHKSKGLTRDEVIIIGLDENFPRNDYYDYWIKSLFKEESAQESIPFAEERRVFYVALTRTSNYVYLLVNKDERKRSSFVKELYSIMEEQNKTYTNS